MLNYLPFGALDGATKVGPSFTRTRKFVSRMRTKTRTNRTRTIVPQEDCEGMLGTCIVMWRTQRTASTLRCLKRNHVRTASTYLQWFEFSARYLPLLHVLAVAPPLAANTCMNTKATCLRPDLSSRRHRRTRLACKEKGSTGVRIY